MHHLHYLDITIILVYMAVCIIMGCARMKGINNIRDYALGGPYISTAMLGAVLFVTHIGAGSTVGDIEQIHSLGLIYAIAVLVSPLIWLTSARIFANHIDYFKKAGCISLSDIMELLYGKPGRWVTNVAAQFMSIFVVAMQIVAIGYLLHYFLNVSQFVGALIGFGTLIVYSFLGGMRAIVFTDAFQGFVLFVGIPAACFAGYSDVGGYDALIATLPPSHTTINFTSDNKILLISFIFWALIPFSNGAFIQRFLMANNAEQLRQVLKTLVFVTLPFALIILLIGFIVKIKAPDIDSNTAFFFLIDNYLPVGVKGLVIVGILSAIMSTADSWLNTVSVSLAHDVVKKLFPRIRDKQEVLVARAALILVAGLAMFVAFYKSGSIMKLQWLASSFWEPVMLIPLMVGFLKFKTNYKSFIGSVSLGIIFTFIGAYFAALDSHEVFDFATISMATGIFGSALGLFITHYVQGLHKLNDTSQTYHSISS